MIDFIFQGAVDERFSDWDAARQFVIFDTIVNNPRFDGETKVKLQQVEQDAYNAHANKTLQSEKTEIARYYTYLRNQFPSVTDDQRFLAIFDAASEVKADESSIGLDDITPDDDTWLTLGVLGLAGVTLYFLFKD